MGRVRRICALALAVLLAFAVLPSGTYAAGGTASAELIAQLPYVGDAESCRMTAEMASAYAGVIRSTGASVVKAALFDAGDGVPMLWVAHGDGWDSRNNALTGAFSDSVYSFANGQAQKCKWITTLLRPGTGGVVMQMNTTQASDHVNEFRLYHLEGGQIAQEPYADGVASPFEGGFINGKLVTAPEAYASVYDLACMIEYDLDVYLEAQSGLADMLFLTGNWADGAYVAGVLDEIYLEAQTPIITPEIQTPPEESGDRVAITPVPSAPQDSAGEQTVIMPAPDKQPAESEEHAAEAPETPTPQSAETIQPEEEKSSLPTSAVVLITLGCTALAAAAVIIAVLFLRRKHKS